MVYRERECCMTILYHAMENTECEIRVARDGKVGCNTVEYTTAFQYSDWLYLLWHGTKPHIPARTNSLCPHHL